MSAAQPLPTKRTSSAGRKRRGAIGCAAVYSTARAGGGMADGEPSAMAMRGLLHVLADKLRHLEHVDLRLAAEHRLERVVRLDHPLVLLVLQAVFLAVGPQLR